MDRLTFSRIFRLVRDEVLTRNGKLSLEAAEREGSDLNILLACCAVATEEGGSQLAEVEAGLFLSSATGEQLNRLVFDRYGFTRKEAAPALGSVEFTTTAPAPSSFTIPANLELLSSGEKATRFITTSAATFSAGSTGPVVVAVRSVEAGADQQTSVGVITNIIGTISGQPVDLEVTNSLATVGAADTESDEALRDRARRFWTAARRGTVRAIEAAALNALGVTSSKAIEVIDVLGRQARFVQLIVADDFARVLCDIGAAASVYATQSQQIQLAVEAAIADVRPAGIYVQVTVARVVLQPITINLRFLAGVDVDLVAAVARATVTAYVNSLSPGSTLDYDELQTALRTVPGLDATSEIASPAGDVVCKPLQVIRTEMRLVTPLSVLTSTALVGTGNPDAYTIANL